MHVQRLGVETSGTIDVKARIDVRGGQVRGVTLESGEELRAPVVVAATHPQITFLQQIDRNYLLLLTATPLQNDLRELYNLVTLLRPGQLGTWQEFQQLHLTPGDAKSPKDPEALKELTAQVMVRTSRHHTLPIHQGKNQLYPEKSEC